MIKKGIILAGGLGTRMSPITKSVNKQLLPIYDKPLIFYPLSILMLAGIKEILIIVNKGSISQFRKILPNGKNLGINIKYAEQDKPRGLPDAFRIGKSFINNDGVALILGDNFFYGQSLSEKLKRTIKQKKGATILLHPVKNPNQFGVATLKGKKIINLIEKPKKTKSNLAITGLYFFDNTVVKKAMSLKKSKRNELEIIDLLKVYKNNNMLKADLLGRGAAWLDAGTIDDFNQTSIFVSAIEKRQGFKIACLEEIAFLNKWIDKTKIKSAISFYGNCEYSKYLKSLI
jgi:glucose-1-phosphate thymidylyltransferase